MSQLVIAGITDPSTLACIARARKYEQYLRAVEDVLKGRCPFCDIDREYNRVIAENGSWFAWPCRPAEANTRIHVLYVPKKHVTDSEELTDDELLDLWGENGLRRRVRRMLGYTSRGTLMRDGDARFSAGTIQHLHVHDMVPDGTGRVESPFYKGAEAERESLARAVVFEKLRQGTITTHLTAEELQLVINRL